MGYVNSGVCVSMCAQGNCVSFLELLVSPRTMKSKNLTSRCVYFPERGEAEGEYYIPLLNDMVTITPAFLGKKKKISFEAGTKDAFIALFGNLASNNISFDIGNGVEVISNRTYA